MERSLAETLNLQASAVTAGDVVLPQATAIPTKPINSLADECHPPMGGYSALRRSDPQLPQVLVHGLGGPQHQLQVRGARNRRCN